MSPASDRRDGRVVEGTPLLREHAGKTCIEGSNPSLSANLLKNRHFWRFFYAKTKPDSTWKLHKILRFQIPSVPILSPFFSFWLTLTPCNCPCFVPIGQTSHRQLSPTSSNTSLRKKYFFAKQPKTSQIGWIHIHAKQYLSNSQSGLILGSYPSTGQSCPFCRFVRG